ncbi:response regulator transcription factor [Campylobacter suis]|uniref:Response regulator ArlR n=1 Tax=Campylobacter suis TaxID=2790657 RepID=A0ABN7K9N4_9BACT|nr:winged helix-turn-helix domain-containing protein [Campylobacter suis]CAD7289234.1 Response regulator ArlR [Campylobacter suis]
MKRILLFSDDFELAVSLKTILYRFNFRIVEFQNEREIIADFDAGSRYDLYVFELKSKNINLNLVKFIRDNENFTPIMLILDERRPEVFKKIYYARVDGFIVKPFLPDEIIFHFFKLTKSLLGTRFEFENGLVFDRSTLLITYDQEKIYLGKKEAMLLESLGKNSPHVVTFSELEYFIYHGENISQDRLRSLVRELRAKLPIDIIKTVRGVGYRIDYIVRDR